MTDFAGVVSRQPSLRTDRGPGAAVAGSGVVLVAERHIVVAGDRPIGVAARMVSSGELPDPAPARWGVVNPAGGRWAVCWWDPTGTTGGLGVDRVGAAPLFVFQTPERLFFATEISRLRAILPSAPGPDPGEVELWLAGLPGTPGRTLFAGIRRLEGGQRVTFGDHAPIWSPRWWPAPPKRHELTSASDAQAVLLAGVADAVARCRPEDPDAGVLLSGGLDSSIVAAQAAARAAAVGLPSPPAFAATFPDAPDLDETAFRTAVARHSGLGVIDVPIRPRSLLPDGLSYLDRWGVPAPSGSPFLFSPVAREAAARGRVRLLDGEGGDELFAPSPFLIADLLGRGDVRGAARIAQRLQDAHRYPRGRVLRHAFRHWGVSGLVPVGVHRMIRKARRQPAEDLAWKTLDGPRWWRSLAYDLTEGHPAGTLDVLRRHAASDGVRDLHPLLDPELVTVVLNIDPSVVFDPCVDRGLVRRAHRDILPSVVIERTTKVDFAPIYFASLAENDAAEGIAALRRPNAPVRQMVPGSEVDAVLQIPSVQDQTAWSRSLWKLFMLDAWLGGL